MGKKRSNPQNIAGSSGFRWVSKKYIYFVFFILLYFVLLIKFLSIRSLSENFYSGLYGVAISFYILGRIAIAFFYSPQPSNKKVRYCPTITFGIPAKNEESHIRETILRIVDADYPKEKIEIIVVNDGSTDNTLYEILRAQKIARRRGVDVKVVGLITSRGKREGMAECINKSTKDIIIFIDSDSFIEKGATKELVRYFVDKKVGAVAGHAFVANADKNILTKMQAVRYFISFKAYKAAESLFGSVTCCSGCCSAYRRSYILPFLETWKKQEFLGVRCTYGDDRSLTNFLLTNGYKTLYAPEAISYTFVPESFQMFSKQQLRWKKSWFRETLLASKFMWRRHPLTSIFFYLGFILTLLAPAIVIYTLIWIPFHSGQLPIVYLSGLILMSALYGTYYSLFINDKKWLKGVFFSALYAIILIWQLPWAILTIRDARWGTR